MTNGPRRLGELLVSKGVITEPQLAAALAEQRSTKELLGVLLIRKGWVSKAQFLQVFAEQLGMEYRRLDPARIDWSVVERLSPSIIKGHRCLPIAMDRTSITVAMVNPLDVWGVQQVEQFAGSRMLQTVLISEEDFAAALAAYRQWKTAARAP